MFLLRFTDRANRKNPKLDPQEVPFLNENSLGFIDDMFFRLPFPDITRMEKLHQSVNVTADVFNFLGEMQDDLRQARAIEDLRRGWQEYLQAEMTSSGFGQHNLGKSSHSQRRMRNKTPTSSEEEEEEEAQVCLLSLDISTVTCI
jgi:hypothetical protein